MKSYDGAVVRTVGDEHEPRRFSIYQSADARERHRGRNDDYC